MPRVWRSSISRPWKPIWWISSFSKPAAITRRRQGPDDFGLDDRGPDEYSPAAPIRHSGCAHAALCLCPQASAPGAGRDEPLLRRRPAGDGRWLRLAIAALGMPGEAEGG